MAKKKSLDTKEVNTWCPGCPNFMILSSIKKALANLKLKKEEVIMTTGIGCHAKIYDYIDLGGVYSLHGRPIPTAIGIKLGNPKLKVLTFAGDGDTYSEGISHFIHACRYNADTNLFVHDNQAFALTTGQATATSQEGFKTKAEPFGSVNKPLNPILLALSSGATFVARAYARDIAQTTKIMEEAMKHKGFSFVEIVQYCLQFNKEMNDLDSKMHKVDNRDNLDKAFQLAKEWNYNNKTGIIPVGIIYQTKKETLNERINNLGKK